MWDAARLRLAAGSYVMGVGCDFDGVVKQYWQVPVEIVRPDGPKGTTLKWSVPLDKQSSVLPNQSPAVPVVAGGGAPSTSSPPVAKDSSVLPPVPSPATASSSPPSIVPSTVAVPSTVVVASTSVVASAAVVTPAAPSSVPAPRPAASTTSSSAVRRLAVPSLGVLAVLSVGGGVQVFNRRRRRLVSEVSS
jgi:hypothetical protein